MPRSSQPAWCSAGSPPSSARQPGPGRGCGSRSAWWPASALAVGALGQLLWVLTGGSAASPPVLVDLAVGASVTVLVARSFRVPGPWNRAEGERMTAHGARRKGAWTGRSGRVGIAVLAVQTVAHALMLSRAWFTQDDYLMLARSVDRPLSWEFLTQGYSGHLFPGGFLLAWFHANHTPLDWVWGIVPLVLLQLACCVMLWLVATRIAGAGWARVPVLVFFALCPLTLISIQWWAVAIQFLPVTLFSLLAVWGYLRWRDGGRRWWWGVVVGSIVGALLFQERGVLVPLTVFLVALALDDSPAWRQRLWRTTRGAWPLWTASAAVVLGYLALHRALVPITTEASTSGDDLELVANLVVRNAVPGLWGGPVWPTVTNDSIVEPPTAFWVAAPGRHGRRPGVDDPPRGARDAVGLGRDGDLHGGQRGTAVLRAQPPGGGLRTQPPLRRRPRPDGRGPRERRARRHPSVGQRAVGVGRGCRLRGGGGLHHAGRAAPHVQRGGQGVRRGGPRRPACRPAGGALRRRRPRRHDGRVVRGRREAVRGPRDRAREPGLRRPGVPPAHG